MIGRASSNIVAGSTRTSIVHLVVQEANVVTGVQTAVTVVVKVLGLVAIHVIPPYTSKGDLVEELQKMNGHILVRCKFGKKWSKKKRVPNDKILIDQSFLHVLSNWRTIRLFIGEGTYSHVWTQVAGLRIFLVTSMEDLALSFGVGKVSRLIQLLTVEASLGNLAVDGEVHARLNIIKEVSDVRGRQRGMSAQLI